MGRNEDKFDTAQAALALFKGALASTGGALAVLYATGFLIVGTNLFHHGLVDPGLANSRYVSVGACFTVLVILTVAPVASLMYIGLRAAVDALELRLKQPRQKPRQAPAEHRITWVEMAQRTALGFLLITVLAFGVPVRIILLLSETGTGAQAIGSGENPKIFYPLLWRLFPDWFLPLAGCGLFLGIAVAIGTYLRSLVARRDRGMHGLIRVALAMLGNVLPAMTLFLLLIALHTYAVKIYPLIKASFGGGSFGYVQFVFEQDKTPQLQGLIPMHHANISRSVRLLSDAGNTYAFFLGEGASGRAGMVDKALVRGLLAVDKN